MPADDGVGATAGAVGTAEAGWVARVVGTGAAAEDAPGAKMPPGLEAAALDAAACEEAGAEGEPPLEGVSTLR